MSERTYSLEEVEALTGVPVATSRKQLNRDPSKGVKVPLTPGGSRMVWRVPESSLNLKALTDTKSRYDLLVEQWEAEQASGYHSGKPIGKIAIDLNSEGLKDFWKKLKMEPDLGAITPENLKRAITSIPVDYEERVCHYATKILMYKGVLSFLKILVRENLMSEGATIEFKKAKPRRVFPPRKTVLDEDSLTAFLAGNQKLCGRTEFDVIFGNALIGVMAYAGLRRKDVIQLSMKDVDLKNGLLYVVDGKGHKNRVVGICPELDVILRSWLKSRPESPSSRFFVKKDGGDITKHVIQNRIYRLAQSTGIDISPHGLRRTFATLNSNKGIPLDMLRLTLGHNKLETTQGYLMTDEMAAAAAIRGPQKRANYKDAMVSAQKDMFASLHAKSR